jgi:predicted secreted protein
VKILVRILTAVTAMVVITLSACSAASTGTVTPVTSASPVNSTSDIPNPVPSPDVTFTDESIPITVSVGQDFAIILKSNATTGFSWVENHENDLLTLEYSAYRNPGGTPLLGASGTQIFIFKTVKSGSTQIAFTYKRSWETTTAQQKVFKVMVK